MENRDSCLPLQTGVALLAVIDCVWMTLVSLPLLKPWLMGVTFLLSSLIKGECPDQAEIWETVLLAIFLSVMAVQIGLSYDLYDGAKGRDLCKLRRWFILGWIFWDQFIIVFCVALYHGVLWVTLSSVIVLFYRILMLFSVKGLMDQVKTTDSIILTSTDQGTIETQEGETQPPPNYHQVMMMMQLPKDKGAGLQCTNDDGGPRVWV